MRRCTVWGQRDEKSLKIPENNLCESNQLLSVLAVATGEVDEGQQMRFSADPFPGTSPAFSHWIREVRRDIADQSFYFSIRLEGHEGYKDQWGPARGRVDCNS